MGKFNKDFWEYISRFSDEEYYVTKKFIPIGKRSVGISVSSEFPLLYGFGEPQLVVRLVTRHEKFASVNSARLLKKFPEGAALEDALGYGESVYHLIESGGMNAAA